MLKLNSVMLGSSDPQKLAEFYAQVFDKPADWEDEGWSGWQFGNFYFTIGEHSEVKSTAEEPQRVIFNLETTQVDEEFARIKKIGADIVAEPYEMGGGKIATFADPDGNYFQLVTPMPMEGN